MKTLEKQLENLYIQKNKIDEEIELLKQKIKIEKEKILLKNDFTKVEITKNENNAKIAKNQDSCAFIHSIISSRSSKNAEGITTRMPSIPFQNMPITLRCANIIAPERAIHWLSD